MVDAFGDFFPSTIPNTQINGRDSYTDDDDDWGDFVKSPLRSNLPNNNPLSDQRPKGPLPLSLFGIDEREDDVAEAEEEERSSTARSTDHSVNNFGNGFSKFGIYNQNHGKGENGFHFNPNSNGNEPDFNRRHLNFELNYDNHGLRIENGSGLSSDSDLFAKNRDFLSLEKGDLNGLGSNSDLVAVNNLSYSSPVKDLSGLSFKSDLFDVKNGENVSGLSSDSDLFAKSRDFSSLGMGDLNGLILNSDLGTVNNVVYGSKINDLSGLSFNSGLLDVKNGGHSPRMKDTILSNVNSDAFSPIKVEHLRIETMSTLYLGMDSFTGNNRNNLVGSLSNFNGLVLNNAHVNGNEEFDDDDDAWEFKDANSECAEKESNNKVNSNHQLGSKVTGISTQADNGSHVYIDFSSTSNGILAKPIETDFRFDFTQPDAAQKSFSGGLNSDPLDSNELFGDFHSAFSGNGLKEEDVPKTGNTSHSEVEVLASNGKAQGNETRTNNHNEALPLSLFGDEELETDNSLNSQEDFSFKPSSTQRDGINSDGSNYSIHDVISNLYSQPQQNASVENIENLTENGLLHTLEDFDEDFDDDSWEFKDASSRIYALELNSHLDFYRKLEEHLSFVCRRHLDNLKKAREAAACSGENAKVAAIEEEIQEACKELQEETSNIIIHSENQSLRETSMNEFLEALHDPKFQVLESRYQLSQKLNLAQNDQKSAFEALKHTKSKLNILTIGSSEDQYKYLSTWYKIISVCAKELKHGSWILKQSTENNLQSHMVSDPRGKDFIISLGEIYRGAIILGASAKLFEPWILSDSVNFSGKFSVLEDCYTLWSSLRIEAAVDLFDKNEYKNKAKELLESIKRIKDLDEVALRDLVFNKQVSTCRLSLLSSEVIPEMNMVMWNGETYFVTLANLWVNLVSCDLPELPCVQVAS